MSVIYEYSLQLHMVKLLRSGKKCLLAYDTSLLLWIISLLKTRQFFFQRVPIQHVINAEILHGSSTHTPLQNAMKEMSLSFSFMCTQHYYRTWGNERDSVPKKVQTITVRACITPGMDSLWIEHFG